MDFDLTSDQKNYRDLAKNFSDKELKPFAAIWDKEALFPKETLNKAGELGFLSLYVDTNLGGMGLGRLDASIVFEQLAQGCTSTTAFMTIHNMAIWMVSKFASEKLKNEWFPQLSTGEKLASYCLTEPGSGSDAASLRTTATKDGSDFILNGSKAFISGSGATDCLILMARTGETGSKGISCFLVPADLPGIEYGKNEPKMGWKNQPTRLVSLTDVRISKDNLIGEEGNGFKIAMQGLDGGRINIATCSIGTAQSALEEAQNYMNEREQFGKKISEFQAMQFKIADMVTDLVAARTMTRLAAYKIDKGDVEATTYSAMAKRFATDVGFNVCNEALQIFGGYGYIQEYPLERHVRDVRVHQILEGTNEIMKMIIGRRMVMEDAASIIQ
ncbi:MAG: acyl-CoA dehydrogenase family protein [SAR86 cluster bacterium]|jgi:alkylation response protein AidB-like acyl-CoA dehydrogenase|nr:acyl-CoA dehydrogenase family protein [SAR86 cluster bacterium]MDG1681447.1 acyl-CoA dehydrogenase family protein [SAR86 cluster bacterium]|tara:strand:- start:14783 stop:15943 length:1161 start_codon:yes stop_codon:yes gene_type:complete